MQPDLGDIKINKPHNPPNTIILWRTLTKNLGMALKKMQDIYSLFTFANKLISFDK